MHNFSLAAEAMAAVIATERENKNKYKSWK